MMGAIRRVILACLISTLPSTMLAQVVPAAIPSVGGSPLMQAVLDIRKQENLIHAIRIHARYRMWGQFYGPTSKKTVWIGPNRPINRYVLVAVMDGLPHGKFRADVSSALTLIRSSGSAYAERFSVAYNGRVGTFLRTATGSPKELRPFNDGTISGHTPRDRGILDQATGWCWSIFGFTGDLPFGYHPRFSQYISPGQKDVTVRSRWTQWNGKTYLWVTRIGSPLGKDVFLLDPRNGFSIAECRHYGWDANRDAAGKVRLTAGTQLIYSFRADSFLEPATGFFYPKEVRMKGFEPKSGLTSSVATAKIVKVVLNPPSVTDRDYLVQYPRGAIVTDLATGKVIRVGGTPREQLDEIEKAARKSHKDLRKSETTRP